jgi:hypothetical protein
MLETSARLLRLPLLPDDDRLAAVVGLRTARRRRALSTGELG